LNRNNSESNKIWKEKQKNKQLLILFSKNINVD
jgi:hypothetical protein